MLGNTRVIISDVILWIYFIYTIVAISEAMLAGYLPELRKRSDIINAIFLFIYLESEAEQHVASIL